MYLHNVHTKKYIRNKQTLMYIVVNIYSTLHHTLIAVYRIFTVIPRTQREFASNVLLATNRLYGYAGSYEDKL